MELGAIVSSLLRRWYIVLAGLIATVGLVYAAFVAVPPTYSASGTVVLLPPAESVPKGANPLLQLGGLEQPASLVVAYVSGDVPRKAFSDAFPGDEYDVVIDPLSRGPLIVMTVKSPGQSEVMQALDAALAIIPEGLSSLQNEVGAPVDARMTSTPLVVDTEPTPIWSSTLRAVIAAAAAGLVLTLMSAVAFDRMASQRRLRRTRVPGNTDDADDQAVGWIDDDRDSPRQGRLTPSGTRPFPPEQEGATRVAGAWSATADGRVDAAEATPGHDGSATAYDATRTEPGVASVEQDLAGRALPGEVPSGASTPPTTA